MLLEFNKEQIKITDVFYCPYHPNARIKSYRRISKDRKPNPGMIFKAAKKHNLDLDISILVGDKISDIKAGKRAGINKSILLKNNQKLIDLL